MADMRNGETPRREPFPRPLPCYTPAPGVRRAWPVSVRRLPDQPEPEQEPQAWEEDEEVSVLGAGVTMQFALPQRMGMRTRWLIAGIGIAILLSAP